MGIACVTLGAAERAGCDSVSELGYYAVAADIAFAQGVAVTALTISCIATHDVPSKEDSTGVSDSEQGLCT